MKEEVIMGDEIDHLHAFIDGLALHVIMGYVPVNSERIQRLMEKEIDKLLK